MDSPTTRPRGSTLPTPHNADCPGKAALLGPEITTPYRMPTAVTASAVELGRPTLFASQPTGAIPQPRAGTLVQASLSTARPNQYGPTVAPAALAAPVLEGR
jgi:hypothetical protein